MSLDGRADRHYIWISNGVLVRIAQKLGYHRDGEQLNLTSFETEMRRRIFWQMLMHDSKSAALSGVSSQFSAIEWDTKKPSNLNDADLFPDSKASVKARPGPTEMIFVTVTCHIYWLHKFAHEDNAVDFEAAIMGEDLEGENDSSIRHRAVLAKMRSCVTDLIGKLGEIREKCYNPLAGKVHEAAMAVQSMITTDLYEALVPMREQPEWNTEITKPEDNFFKFITITSEHRSTVDEKLSKAGFLWYIKANFQVELLAYLIRHLIVRTQGTLADRGWDCVRRTYELHPELFDASQDMYLTQGQLTLVAWRAREVSHARDGWSLDTPAYIVQLRGILLFEDGNPDTNSYPDTNTSIASGYQLSRSDALPQQLHLPQQMDMQVGPHVTSNTSVSSFDSEMFGFVLPSYYA